MVSPTLHGKKLQRYFTYTAQWSINSLCYLQAKYKVNDNEPEKNFLLVKQVLLS